MMTIIVISVLGAAMAVALACLIHICYRQRQRKQDLAARSEQAANKKSKSSSIGEKLSGTTLTTVLAAHTADRFNKAPYSQDSCTGANYQHDAWSGVCRKVRICKWDLMIALCKLTQMSCVLQAGQSQAE